jgi:hypothetical protein
MGVLVRRRGQLIERHSQGDGGSGGGVAEQTSGSMLLCAGQETCTVVRLLTGGDCGGNNPCGQTAMVFPIMALASKEKSGRCVA